MADRVRWVCPLCQRGALGPSRPRRENIVRWCLDCSKKTGKLVARAAPVVEARRAASRERSAAKQTTKRSADAVAWREHAERLRLDGLVAGYPVPFVVGVCRDVFNAMAAEGRCHSVRGTQVSVSRDRSHSWNGRGGRYRVTLRSARSPDPAVELQWMLVGLLHELAHAAAPEVERHGGDWRRIYREAVESLTGRRVPPEDGRSKYSVDDTVRVAVEEWLAAGGRWPGKRSPILRGVHDGEPAARV